MATGAKYTIDLLKVKKGPDDYKYDIDGRFFEKFEESSLHEGKILAQISIERTRNTFDAVIEVEGNVRVECDRCLKSIDFPVKQRLDFIVKLADGENDGDDEIVYVAPQAAVFDATQHIYDAIYVALPIRKTCDEAGIEEGCDKVMLEKLKITNTDDDEGENTDPRWEKLKDLLE